MTTVAPDEKVEARRERDRLRKRRERGATPDVDLVAAEAGERQPGRRGPRSHNRFSDGQTSTMVARGIGAYLDEIAANRVNEVDPSTVAAEIEKVEKLIASQTSSIAMLRLRQRLLDLRNANVTLKHKAHFVKYAAEFAERNGISYGAFREMAVPASVLKEAGISR